MAFQMKMPAAQSEDVQKSLRQIHSWLYQLNENLQYTFSHLDEDNFTDAFLLSLRAGDGELADKVERLSRQMEQLFSASWMPLTLTSAQAFSADCAPLCCLRGRCAYLSGAVSLTSSLAAGSSRAIATLPMELRPARDLALTVSSDAGALCLRAQADGDLVLCNTASSALTSATFISVACNYAL